MTYINAVCTTESDGFHAHTYRSGAAIVTHHLHAWMDLHLTYWKGSSRVYIGDRPYAGTPEQAWQELTGKPLPDADCKEAS